MCRDAVSGLCLSLGFCGYSRFYFLFLPPLINIAIGMPDISRRGVGESLGRVAESVGGLSRKDDINESGAIYSETNPFQ